MSVRTIQRGAIALLFVAAWARPVPGAELRLERVAHQGYRLTLPRELGPSWQAVNVARLLVRIPGGAGSLAGSPLPSTRELEFDVTSPGCSLVQVDLGPAGAATAPDAWQRVTHCSKIVVCADTGDQESDRRARLAAGEMLTAKSGSRIEIRPLFNPAVLVPGSALPVRLYSLGRAISGGVVEALDAAGARLAATADRQGIAVVTLAHSGAWRLHFTHGGREAELAFDVRER
jgi:Domain of unknown function (DUF4198)